MDERKLAALALQSPIDPLKVDPASITLSSQHLGLQSVRFWCRQGARGELYGYEPAEVIGKLNASTLYTPEDVHAGKPQAVLASALQAGKWAGTLTRRRQNGQRFPARAVVTPRCDATGRAIGFWLISKDICCAL